MSYLNPYDFGRPVKDPSIFAGRKEELSEIEYYLDLSFQPIPIYYNLAVIGKRAVGKTSVLNMIQHIAENKDCLCIKLALNEGIVSNEILLFKELFDHLITEAAEKGVYDGLTGKSYQLFRKVIDSLDAEIRLPLLFSNAYIGFKKGKKTSYSQKVLMHDFTEIYKEVSKHDLKTIVVMLDECDLLANNRSLLQIFRNIFTDIEGYILVFCGTDKMFPDMNEVFSPLPRSFKRISIDHFKSVDETKECILNPLDEHEKKLVSRSSINEIHTITNGNPYEVKLLSHFMYKNYIENRLDKIVLDVNVLDSVLVELDRLRKSGHHDVANKIRSIWQIESIKAILSVLEYPDMSKRNLARLLTLDNIESIDFNEITEKNNFHHLILSDLIDRSILVEQDNVVSFGGDEFDIMYLKHYALSKGVEKIQFGMKGHPVHNIQNKLTEIMLRDVEEYQLDVRFDQEKTDIGESKPQELLYGARVKPKPEQAGKWTTVIEFSIKEINEKFYSNSPNSFRFRVINNLTGSGYLMQVVFTDDKGPELLREKIQDYKTKLSILGIDFILTDEIDYNIQGVGLVRKGEYDSAQIKFDQGLALNPDFELLWANKGRAFFESKQYEDALSCFKKWSDIRSGSAHPLERIGASLIHLGKMDEAIESLEKAVKVMPEYGVAWENLGRAQYFTEKFADSIQSMSKVIALRPDYFVPYLFSGICHLALDRQTESLEMLEKALVLKPNDPEILLYKSTVFLNLRQYEEAVMILDEILSIFPNDLSLLNMKSTALSKQGKNKEAIELCNRILKLDPNFAVAYFNRGCYNALLGNKELMLSDLKKAIELDELYVEMAKKDADFDVYWNDSDFKGILNEAS
ncbi:MAG: tetratricopeptide repeat protein [Candidatus Bathyarchaeota archaeon]|nr:tetratricopeptide repeat protein [Candidatus Bathyarchaeota archaeon]